MSSIPKIGIGITTYKRPELIQQCLAELNARLPPNSTLFVNDDSERAEGIAAAKNRCLAALEDCDYIFLFDDDIWPCKDRWWEPFIKGVTDYNCHVFSSSWNTVKTNYIVARKGSLLSLKWVCGVCVFLTKKVLETIGGYNIMFGKWGGEHEEYAQRAWLNGLAPYRLCDLEGSINNFTSLDRINNATSTVNSHNRTPSRTISSYFDRLDPSWKPYKQEEMILVPEDIPVSITNNWAGLHSKRIIVPYRSKLDVDALKAPHISYVNLDKESLQNYLWFYRQYIKGLTMINPVCLGGEPDISHGISVCSTLGYSDYNQVWLYRMPHVTVSQKVLSPAYIRLAEVSSDYLMKYTLQTQLPAHSDSPYYAAVNMLPPSIDRYHDVRPVIMISSDNREKLSAAMERYKSSLWRTVGVLLGAGIKQENYSEESGILEVPARYTRWDMFDCIMRKWPASCGIYKVDSSIQINEIDRLEAVVTLNHMKPFWIIRVLYEQKPLDVGYYAARGFLELVRKKNAQYAEAPTDETANGIILQKYNIVPECISSSYVDTKDITVLT